MTTASLEQMKSFTALIQAEFLLRTDPLDVTTKNKIRHIPKVSSETNGRNAFARLLFSQRWNLLGLSLAAFSELCCEDRKRQDLLRLASDFDGLELSTHRGEFFNALRAYENQRKPSESTLSRLEHSVGDQGATVAVISTLAERLVNPVTKDFFTPGDLVLLYQGFESPEVNLKLTDEVSKRIIGKSKDISEYDVGAFVSLVRHLNRTKSERLLYKSARHSF